MQILLLGTGGADGIPAFYGNDRVSNHARKHGGRDVRSRSAAIIDGILKIDLGPDTQSQMIRHGLSPRDWFSLFLTHSDDDHLCLSEIQYGLFPFVECEKLEYTIYGNATVCDLIRKRYPEWPMNLVELHKYISVEDHGYAITPLHATHKEDEECHNFLIEKDNKKFLYATDTGYYRDEVFDFLAGKQIGGVVIECSDGFHKTPYVGHMDLAQCVDTVSRLRENGAIATDAQVFTTHNAAGGGGTHAELEAALVPHGIYVGYDGLQIDL
jgi:phosphoribosyl 1,2-cyclic phosphate phosphodiesterase